jgi:geranylgeranyl diphosphate synthase, type II
VRVLAQEGIEERVAPELLAPSLDTMQQIRARVEHRLEELAPRPDLFGHRVADAIGYSLLGGGKRLRPILTVLAARMLGSNVTIALDPACAVEMVHTASLILDDLPCMDDATLRRGKPANHRVYGDDVASLAAVTLVSEAFAVISRSPGLTGVLRAELVGLLAEAIGLNGLAGGQAGDLAGVTAHHDQHSLERMEVQKTAALFVTSARIGARIAGAGEAEVEALSRYARDAGLAFQIFDDLLDTFGNGTAIGKDVQQDGDKATFSSVMGRPAAEALALERCRSALGAVANLRRHHHGLAAFLEVIIDAYHRQTGAPS